MLSTFVIGLREGLEASLIVGIIAAFLASQERRDALRWVWAGVAAAASVCVAVGIALHVAGEELPRKQQEGLETVIAVVAVAAVTWMIVWMKRHAPTLSRELRENTAAALATGSALGLIGMAFLAVLREGLETAVFLVAAFNASNDVASSAIGALLGLALAIAIGYGIYAGGVKLNLTKFFKATGVLLAFVAAGLLSKALHTAHEAGWWNGLQDQAVNLSGLFPNGSIRATLFTGIFGIDPRPSVGELLIWAAYLVPVIAFVLAPAKARPAAAAAASAVQQPAISGRARNGLIGGALLAFLATGAFFATASGSSSPAGNEEVAVKLSDAGCEPADLTVPAGPTTFVVSSDGAKEVTEFEVLDGSRILVEAENVAAGLERSVSVTLKPGTYETTCPGGTTAEMGTLTVTGDADDAGTVTAEDEAAVATYRTFLEEQTAILTPRVEAFAAAVKAGDVAKAKRLFSSTRQPYERVEPVAEAFGDLDPKIDIRINDVGEGDEFTGFHRIERELWKENSTAGLDAIADQLVHDVKDLEQRVKTIELEPAQVANGAVELLGEVSKSKITGEEDRYSHTDLADFEANVEGAKAAFEAVRPVLVKQDAALADLIAPQFEAVFEALAPYKSGDGFVSYTDLTSADKRKLSGALDRLAEPLSQVPAKVVG
ncbi:MAG: iron uptake system protein EfeO [Patulibacter minatonensis]